MANPEVLTGARGPRDERLYLERLAAAKRSTGLVAIPENQVWFQSRFTRLRVQLTAPEDVRLPDGRLKRGAGLVVQFQEGMARLDKKKDEERINLLRDRENFGLDFWDFSDVLKKEEETERENAVAVLRDPKQRELVIAALKADGVDFALPTRSKGKRSAGDEAIAS